MVFIGVDIDRIDKLAPRGVKSAPGAIELNRHFGAETDLLNLQCTISHFFNQEAASLVISCFAHLAPSRTLQCREIDLALNVFQVGL